MPPVAKMTTLGLAAWATASQAMAANPKLVIGFAIFTCSCMHDALPGMNKTHTPPQTCRFTPARTP